MARLTRDQFLQPIRRTEVVPVPEFGPDAEVEICELSAAQRDAIARSIKPNAPGANLDATLKAVLEAMCDPKLQPGDYEALKGQSSAAVDRIATRIMVLSGMTQAQQAEILGKSNQTPN